MRTLAVDFAQRIRGLAEVRSDDPVVLTVYLSLDPTEFPTAKQRITQIESLMDDARRRVADASLSHDAFKSLSDDVDRVRDYLADEFDPNGAHAVAVFCSSQSDLFETIKLSGPVPSSVDFDREAHLGPLVRALPGEAWCIFLVNRSADRILRGSRDRLFETGRSKDDVHGRHDQGGWSQAGYERSVNKEVSDRVRAACDELYDSFQRNTFDKLLLGCPEALRPEVESKLHSSLTQRLVQRFDLGVELENPDEVLDRVRPIIEQEESREEAALIERLAQGLGRNERAVSGLDAVRKALDERRVEILLVDPRGGESAAAVESAIRDAILQAAAVHEIRYHDPARALGAPIAALLRF